MSGELHHHRLETHFAQFLCPNATVIEIPGEAAPQRDADLPEAAGDRSSDDPEARMAFADIVEQSGADQVFPVRHVALNPLGRLQGVALISDRLLVKHSTFDIGRDPCINQRPFELVETAGRCDLHEPARQVPPGPELVTLHHFGARQALRDLQSMQRTDVGRASIRAAPIWLPQVAQIP